MRWEKPKQTNDNRCVIEHKRSERVSLSSISRGCQDTHHALGGSRPGCVLMADGRPWKEKLFVVVLVGGQIHMLNHTHAPTHLTGNV